MTTMTSRYGSAKQAGQAFLQWGIKMRNWTAAWGFVATLYLAVVSIFMAVDKAAFVESFPIYLYLFTCIFQALMSLLLVTVVVSIWGRSETPRRKMEAGEELVEKLKDYPTDMIRFAWYGVWIVMVGATVLAWLATLVNYAIRCVNMGWPAYDTTLFVMACVAFLGTTIWMLATIFYVTGCLFGNTKNFQWVQKFIDGEASEENLIQATDNMIAQELHGIN